MFLKSPFLENSVCITCVSHCRFLDSIISKRLSKDNSDTINYYKKAVTFNDKLMAATWKMGQQEHRKRKLIA